MARRAHPTAPTTALVPVASVQALSTILQLDRQRAERDREYLRAESTRGAYDRAWRAFAAWCSSRGLLADSVEDSDLAAYLSWLSEQRPSPPNQRRHGAARLSGTGSMSWSTVAQAYSAIAMVYRSKRRPGWDGPRACPPAVWQQYEAIRRKLGVASKAGKLALLLEHLRPMVLTLQGDGLPTLRDRALLLVDYFLADRSEETVGLDVEDVEPSPGADGSFSVVLRRAKNDQQGRGFTKGLVSAGGDQQLCPVRALTAWMRGADIRSGPIFRPFGPHGELLDQRLSPRHVTEVVKRAARAAGFDEAFVTRVASHSLRAGFITQATINGASLEEIASHTGHKDMNTLRGYVRRANVVGKSNPIRRMI
jgi:site-specific recombinase XerD